MNKQPVISSKENDINASNRRDFLKKASIGGLGMGFLGNNPEGYISSDNNDSDMESSASSNIRITDLRCAVIGNSPIVRIVTDQGISGYGQIESAKASYIKPHVLFYKDYLVGEDPTNVERVMMKIRRMGSFKPWGSAVSAIEMALWDIAGRAANLPVYKLLGGKVRDQVRCYCTTMHRMPVWGNTPQDYADWGARVRDSEHGFSIIKSTIAYHSPMPSQVPNFTYRNISPAAKGSRDYFYYRGPLTGSGIKYITKHVEAMRKGLGDDHDLVLDCGPGFMLSDAIRVAKALEPFNIMWLEDMLTGDYTPYVLADDYRRLTESTSVPIHTGEQLYLRQNFRELIERHAVNILGPDPADMGGIAELKWVAEFADLYGIQIAPHGIFNGVLGVAAHVQVGATMPENYIAFEYSHPDPVWWCDIVEGLPDPVVKNGLVDVWDRPGMGVDFIVSRARKHLREEDKNFFD